MGQHDSRSLLDSGGHAQIQALVVGSDSGTEDSKACSVYALAY